MGCQRHIRPIPLDGALCGCYPTPQIVAGGPTADYVITRAALVIHSATGPRRLCCDRCGVGLADTRTICNIVNSPGPP
jgi:hypothetical protein